MSIFLKELKANRRALFIWTLCTVFVILASAMKYAAAYKGNADISEMIGNLPPIMSAFLGLGKNVDITKAVGFYCLTATLIFDVGGFYAAILGARVISREEQDKTSEFLYSKPIGRSRILICKLSAAFCCAVFFAAASGISSYLSFSKVSEEALLLPIIKVSLAFIALQTVFLIIGAAIAARARKPASSVSLAMGLAFLTMFFEKLVNLSERAAFLSLFTPMKYFEPEDVLFNGIEPLYLTLAAIMLIVLGRAVFEGYRKKDLTF